MNFNSKADFQDQYEQKFQQARQNAENMLFKLPEIREFNRKDESQDYYIYKVRLCQNSKCLVLKIGYRIGEIKKEEQDLALFCLSLMQAEAQFPIKYFFTRHEQILNNLVIERKYIWMQTQILISNKTYSQKEVKFQAMINNYFKETILPSITDFFERYINWSYMISQEYTDQKVIHQFQTDIINPLNQKYKNMLKMI